MSYPSLNLPSASLRTRATAATGKTEVWDAVRRRWLVLTPEEWVRQHFIHFLIAERGVEPHRIVQEYPIRVDGFPLRADIVIYGSKDSTIPLMMVECKASTVKITQDVFDQVARYNIDLGAQYIAVTNGIQHYCCHVDHHERSYRFINTIPEL